MKGFAFGQYYPARSVLHRLDPRAKVLAAVIYIVAAFLCKNTVSFGILLLSGLILMLISRIPMKVVMRSIRALVFMISVCHNASSLSLLFCSTFGLPVSTTHAKTTSIMGVGAVKRLSAINFSVVKEMALTWVLTFPGCGLIGFLMTKLFMWLF